MGLSVLGFDQAGVDRCREARIVQLDGEVFALRFAGGLLPGRAELGRTGEDAEVRAALAFALGGNELALTLRVRVLTAPVKPAPFSFFVKVPMVAIVVFLFLSGRTIATSMVVVRPGTIGPAPLGAGTKWKAAGGGFFASRCKARSCAAEKSWRRTLRETSEAKPVIGQTQANRDRGWSARFRNRGNTAMAAALAYQRSRTETAWFLLSNALPP